MGDPSGTIGDRLRELRRGVYTQVDLAVAADVSVDVIRKLEQGRRLTASIATLQRIARALGVDLARLLGSSRPVPTTGEEQGRVLAIRDALTSVDDLLGELDDADAPDLTELGRAVTYGWGAYWSGRYGVLASMLPRLLAEAQAAAHGATAGRCAQLSVYGGLLLGGATAAARERRTGAATDLLSEATAIAERTGTDRTDYEVVFGPSNVVMQSTDVAVVAEDYNAAAKIARRMSRDAALPLAARSRHLADVAHAQVRLGRYQVAESVLLSMEQAAPEWTAHHRLPRLLVSELLTHGRPSTRLRELSQRLHATTGARHK